MTATHALRETLLNRAEIGWPAVPSKTIRASLPAWVTVTVALDPIVIDFVSSMSATVRGGGGM